MITISNLTLTYAHAAEPVFSGINLEVSDGEFTLLVGKTGAGKTSILMAIAGLVPSFTGGRLSGSILINGIEQAGVGPENLADQIGYVGQKPECTFVAETVIEELAFGLELRGYPADEMRQRVNEISKKLRIDHLLERKVLELSGGEQQRVAIAAALIGGQRILLLDEPTSALDSSGAELLIKVLASLNKDHGYTILASEHRFGQIRKIADSVAVLNSASKLRKFNSIAASQADFDLNEADWNLPRANQTSKIVVLFGSNGSGKSTALWRIQRQSGAVMVPQSGSDLLYLQSIAAECQEADDYAGAAAGSALAIFRNLVGEVNLDCHPRDLSAGQQLALAIAVQTVRSTPLLLLDEPTRGLDQIARHAFAIQLRSLQAGGQNIILATHDRHFADQIADEVIDLDSDESIPPLKIGDHEFLASELARRSHAR